MATCSSRASTNTATTRPWCTPRFAPPETTPACSFYRGGDGLAAREVFRYPDVEQVTLIDLDGAVTKLAVGYGELSSLNGHSFDNPKMRLINDDAM